jgi:GT2 family glycosyltransferase
VDLSIILVNWNTRDLLRDCLASVYQQEPDIELEVWVVDNASGDGSAGMARQQFPQARLIENPENLGFARANNQALALARGRYLMLLNTDTLARPGAFRRMVRFADAQADAGVVGCRLLNADGSLQPSWAGFPTLWSEMAGRNVRRRRLASKSELAWEVDWVGGACLMARRQALHEVGLLDESFFMYSEEVDWCLRMRRRGWKVYYLETAEVVHLGGGSARRASAAQLTRLYDSKLRFFRKHYGQAQARLLQGGLLASSAFGLARRAAFYPLQRGDSGARRQRLAAQWQLTLWLLRWS